MRFLLDPTEVTLLPDLQLKEVNTDALDKPYRDSGYCPTLLDLITDIGFGYQECKNFAKDVYDKHDQKLVFYDSNKEYRLYDSYKLTAGSNATRYCFRLIDNILLYIAALPVDGNLKVSVITVENGIPLLHFNGLVPAIAFGNSLSVATVLPISVPNSPSDIIINPLEIYIEGENIIMVKINQTQVI